MCGGGSTPTPRPSPCRAGKPCAGATGNRSAGGVLRLEPAAVDRDVPFRALGLDSLMTLELRNRLEAAFGLKLSPTLLWTYGTPTALSRALADQLAAVMA